MDNEEEDNIPLSLNPDEYLQIAGLQSYYLYRSIKKWYRYTQLQHNINRLKKIYQKYQLHYYIKIWQKEAKLLHRQRLVQAIIERKQLQLYWKQWYKQSRISQQFYRLESLINRQIKNQIFQRWKKYSQRLSSLYVYNLFTKLNTSCVRYQLQDSLRTWYNYTYNPPLLSLTQLTFSERYKVHIALQRWKNHSSYNKQLRASLYLFHQRKKASLLPHYFQQWKKYINYTKEKLFLHENLAESHYIYKKQKYYFLQWKQYKLYRLQQELLSYEREQLLPRVRYYLRYWYSIIQQKHQYKKALVDSQIYYTFQLQTKYFYQWKTNIQTILTSRRQYLQAIQYSRMVLLRKIFQYWKHYRILRKYKFSLYQKSLRFFTQRYVVPSLHHWQQYTIVCKQQRNIRGYYNQRLLQKYFQRWKNYNNQQQYYYQQQAIVRSKQEQIQKHNSIQWWYRYTKYQQIQQHIQKKHRLLVMQKYFRTWLQYIRTDTYRSKTITLIQLNQQDRLKKQVLKRIQTIGKNLLSQENYQYIHKVLPFQQTWQRKHVKYYLKRWLTNSKQLHTSHVIEARIRYNHHTQLLKYSFARLYQYKQYRQHHIQLQQAADRFYAIALAWKSWKQWKDVYNYKLHLQYCEEKIIQNHQLHLKKFIFRQWKIYKNYRKEIGLLYLHGLHLRSIINLPLLKNQTKLTTTISHPPGSEHETEPELVVPQPIPSTILETNTMESTISSIPSWNYVDNLLHTMENQLQYDKQQFQNTKELLSYTNSRSSTIPSNTTNIVKDKIDHNYNNNLITNEIINKVSTVKRPEPRKFMEDIDDTLLKNNPIAPIVHVNQDSQVQNNLNLFFSSSRPSSTILSTTNNKISLKLKYQAQIEELQNRLTLLDSLTNIDTNNENISSRDTFMNHETVYGSSVPGGDEHIYSSNDTTMNENTEDVSNEDIEYYTILYQTKYRLQQEIQQLQYKLETL